MKRTISAGVLDSAMASLATFLVGLQAVRLLDPESLGAYAMVFSGFTVLMEVAARLVLFPAEVHAARRSPAERMGGLMMTLRLASGPIAAAGLLVAVVGFVLPAEVNRDVAVALVVTAVPTTMVSPIQDHLRKILHIGGKSSAAAAVSAVQLTGVVLALGVMTVVGAPAAWQPFGALLVANLASGAVALAVWVHAKVSVGQDLPGFVDLARSGRWHLLGAATPKLGAFAAASLVAHVAGAPALGYAEGARVLARPIGVLSQGIKSSIGPSLMRAAMRGDRLASRRLGRIYSATIGGCGAAYLALAGFDWSLNPLASVIPTAYAVPGVAAAMIAVFTLDRVAGAGAGLQLFGAGRERQVAVVETAASLGHVIAGATAAATGTFAIPMGYLLTSVFRRPWLVWHVRRVYDQPPTSRTVPIGTEEGVDLGPGNVTRAGKRGGGRS